MTLENDKHLRFVYYTPLDDSDTFNDWVNA